MKQNDGGPAFPGPESHGDDHEGMSLRDYFAAKAMQGMLASDSSVDRTKVNRHIWANAAYEFADAMITARLK